MGWSLVAVTYSDNRFQRVLVNGQTSEWKPSKSRCSPGFNSWITIFLVYINAICSNLSTNVTLFADDTLLFSIVNDANKSFQNLSNDLCIISNKLTNGKRPQTATST